MVARRIDAMYERFGIASGLCGNCPHFRVEHWDKDYFKCAAYGTSRSEATDWRKNYIACGLIDHPMPGGMTVFDEIKYLREPENIQCEGQIGMEEFLNESV